MPATAMVDKDYLRPAEVARLFRVNPETVTRWAKEGWVQSARTPGGHRRYSVAEIDRLLAEGTERNGETGPETT